MLTTMSIGMQLNDKKTTLMIFNSTKNRQCIPYCALKDGEPLQVVDQMRLLGLIIDDGLTWWPLVRDVIRRSQSKIWSLLKLREVGADRAQLICLYVARVRSTVEFGAQVYGPIVNAGQSEALEAIQRRCCQIILGPESLSYARNLLTLGLETLEMRREHLVRQFAISLFHNVEHRWWFKPHPLHQLTQG